LFAPIQHAPLFRTLLATLTTQPVVAVLLTALLTWAAHSSVAVVVLIMSLSGHGLVEPNVAFAMVLGANLGTAINPLTEGVSGEDPAARRLPLGNLLTRIVGVLAGVIVLPWLTPWMESLAGDPSRAVANVHTIFNVIIAIVFLPLLKPYAALLTRWLPRRTDPNDPSRPQYLDESAHKIPAVALGSAAREALRMADMLQTLLFYARSGFNGDNRHRLVQARQLDSAIDKIESAITTYLATLDHETMTREDRRRLEDVLAFTSNIGHASDIAYHGLLGHIGRLRKQGISLSPEQLTALDQTLAHLIGNQRQTAALFVNEDVRQARALAGEKGYFRKLELDASEQNILAIQAGHLDAAEPGAIFLDVLRDLKSINSHLVGAAAYPLLAHAGELLPDRLREPDAEPQ
jgi:phosphate:Na+ symporter